MLISYLLIVAVVCAFAGGMILDAQGRFGAGLVLGFLFGPFGLALAMVLRMSHPASAKADERKCPECAEVVKRDAVRCRFCGAGLAMRRTS